MGRLLRAEMYRLVHERQFLFALLVILGLYQFMYMGGSYYALQGFDALTRSMVAVRLGCVLLVAAMFGGSYLAEDFEARTFQSHVVDGATRGQALLARLLVFYVAELLLVLAFPLVYTLYCTLANGGVGVGGARREATRCPFLRTWLRRWPSWPPAPPSRDSRRSCREA